MVVQREDSSGSGSETFTEEKVPQQEEPGSPTGTSLLKTTPPSTTSTSSSPPVIAYFHRNEAQLGKLVGEGYFSKVYEITSFSVRSSNSDSLSEEETQQRLSCQERVLRSDGTPRYVLKHLHPRLLSSSSKNNLEGFRNAAIDLAVEAKFLLELNHPHILQLRGMALGGTSAFRGGRYDSFFLILDRFSETLRARIQRWKRHQQQQQQQQQQQRQPHSADTSTCTSTSTTLPSLQRRLEYALQMAQAFAYLHYDCNLIFRDLKPDNVGFHPDDPDCLQLFDFGLCRALPQQQTSNNSKDSSNSTLLLDEAFCISGGAGTRRYMAVEVCLHQPYGRKADVYSWAMVTYHVLTLQKPFEDFSKQEHQKFVVELGGTPNLNKHNSMPNSVKDLLRHAWARDVSKRWTSLQVCDALQHILKELRNNKQQNKEEEMQQHNEHSKRFPQETSKPEKDPEPTLVATTTKHTQRKKEGENKNITCTNTTFTPATRRKSTNDIDSLGETRSAAMATLAKESNSLRLIDMGQV
jgi:serine/threonine protein kinase